jgi:tetratricopeptide (TPR) repeat protein
MLRRLLAHAQCQLALHQWEDRLEVALRLFWLGDFAAADDLLGQLLRRIIPYLAILEAPPRDSSRRDAVTERLFRVSIKIAAARWAISYVQGQHAPLPHPPIRPQTPGAEDALRFIVDVHLARADLSGQALVTYAEFIDSEEINSAEIDREEIDSNEDIQRLARIEVLMQSASPSPAAERVLRKLYAYSTDYVASGRRLCAWLIQDKRLSEAQVLAEQLFRRHPTDAVCADLLAYTAEVTQNWRIACAAYSRAGNLLRSAFMAMLANDQALLAAAVQELPDEELRTPLGYLCEGRRAYQRGKLRQALDAWILAVAPGSNQEQDIPLLVALRSFEEDPVTALLEIRSLADSRLPPVALTTLGWIAEQTSPRPRRRKSAKQGKLPKQSNEPTTAEALRECLLTQRPEDKRDPGYPFLKAVAASASLAFLTDATTAERPVLLRWIDSPLRNQMEAIHYAGEARWLEALAVLGQAEVTPLHRRLAGKAITESLQRRDWSTAHQLLEEWRPVLHTIVSIPNLAQRLHQELWEAGDYLLLAQEMIRCLLNENEAPGFALDFDETTLRSHHNAAIVSSRLAQATHTIDGWRTAIAHWAVVLSSGAYWRHWYEQRRSRYGGSADTLDPTHLPERIAQQVAEFWQRGLTQDTKLRCLALLAWEWQNALAMRHLFRVAASAGVTLPQSVLRLTSPTLIGYFAADDAAAFLTTLATLDVTEDARSLLQAAFSPDAEIEALTTAGHFDLALNLARARGLPSERLRPLETQAQRQMIDELLERGDADGALHMAVSLYQEIDDAPLSAMILTSTAQQWTAQIIDQGQPQKAIQRLVELQTRFNTLRPSFHPLIAFAYAYEGEGRLVLGDLDNAQLAFLNALQYDEHNETARAQLSTIHHNRAVDAIEAGDAETAQSEATQAMRYLADPETATLLVDVHTRLAQMALQRGEWQAAQQHIHETLRYGRNCDDANLFTECVKRLLADFVTYRRQDQAVALLEAATRLPHNRAILDIENALASLLVRELGGRRV